MASFYYVHGTFSDDGLVVFPVSLRLPSILRHSIISYKPGHRVSSLHIKEKKVRQIDKSYAYNFQEIGKLLLSPSLNI